MDFDFYIRRTEKFTESQVKEALEELSPYRREKITVCKKISDRNLKLCASLLLKEGLEKYGIDEKNARYIFNSCKKPFIKDCDVNFNLSHSGDYAAAVFSRKPVGCDIQKICSFNGDIPKRFFTEYENEYLNSSKDKTQCFFRIWTMKESAVKALGISVADIGKIEIKELDTKPCAASEGRKLCFYEKDLKGYKISVCVAED